MKENEKEITELKKKFSSQNKKLNRWVITAY